MFKYLSISTHTDLYSSNYTQTACLYCVHAMRYYTLYTYVQDDKWSTVSYEVYMYTVQTYRKYAAEVSRSVPIAGDVTVASLQMYNCAHFSYD